VPEDVSFFSRKELVCPVCGTRFHREDLLTGRGRLNAGELTNELRRLYIPTQKYGEINPLLYSITTCPGCFYSAEKKDFDQINKKKIEDLKQLSETRAKYLIKVFGKVPDFTDKRDLISGTASYILAISCYPFFDKKKFAPAAKMGIFSLRTAWLLDDLFKQNKKKEVFYRKAAHFYNMALERQTRAEENMDAKWLGPDTDNDFGYDGFLYVTAVLNYKTAVYIEDPLKKLKVYEESKRVLSKVFGVGKRRRKSRRFC